VDFITSLLIVALQVGPNPTVGNTVGDPDLLRDRPPRPAQEKSIEDDPATQWLAQCLSMLPDEAARAHTLSQVRRNETQGRERILANHCLGLASTELSLWEDAISAFTAARDETPADEMRAKARFGAMAGNAAFAAKDLERSQTILKLAKDDAIASASAPMQAIIASDLARVYVALQRQEDALAELETSTQLLPQEASTWLLKATLLRRLDRLEDAQTAIEQAGELAPTNAPIGLEAGVIAILSGRDEAARESWQSVIDLAPESPEALTAQGYLGQLAPAQ
jgi:tetratricopeptide (TPR) repeat protein